MNFDRKYLVWGLSYAIAGMGLGVYMGASQNHIQLVTHAHILLVGFAVSMFYGIIHKLWLSPGATGIATIQFYTHQAGTFAMVAGLFLLYGRFMPEEQIGPVLGISSIVVLAAMLMMMYMVVRSRS
jgi:hypothetical protein